MKRKFGRLTSLFLAIICIFVVSMSFCAAMAEEEPIGSIERAADDKRYIRITLQYRDEEINSSQGILDVLEMNEFPLTVELCEVKDGKVMTPVFVTDECSFTVSNPQYARMEGTTLKVLTTSEGNTFTVTATYQDQTDTFTLQSHRLQPQGNLKVLTHAALSGLCYVNNLPIGKYVRDFLPTFKAGSLDDVLRDGVGNGGATNRHLYMATVGDYKVIAIKKDLWLGFYAVVFENDAKHRVIAFRGTSDAYDLIITDVWLGLGATGTAQFEDALKLYNQYRCNGLTLTGHSLGGGLANYISLLTGTESLTFNAPSTFITTINTNLNLFAKRFNGRDANNYTDYSNPNDGVSGAAVGDNPSYNNDSLGAMLGYVLSKPIEYGLLDRTVNIVDQSRNNGVGPIAPYHYLKQMIAYDPSSDSIQIYGTGNSPRSMPDEPDITVRNIDYRIGKQKADTQVVNGENKAYLFGGAGNDTLKVSANSAYISSGQTITSFSQKWDTSKVITMVGGPGDDMLHGSNFDDVYIYTSGDGIDVIDDISGKDTIRMPDHAAASISVKETTNGHEIYADGSLAMRLNDRNGTGSWTISCSDSRVFAVDRPGKSNTIRNYTAIGPVVMVIKDASGNIVYRTINDGNVHSDVNEYGSFYTTGGITYATLTQPGLTVTIVSRTSTVPRGSLRIIPRDTDAETFDFTASFTDGDGIRGWSVTGIPVYEGSVYTTYSSYDAGILDIDYDGDGVKDMEAVYTPMTALSIEAETVIPYGMEYQLNPVMDSNGKKDLLYWSSSAPQIASVSETGLVTAHNVGTAVITVEAMDGSGLTASCTVTVPATDIPLADCDFELSGTHFEYTGKQIMPEITGSYLGNDLLAYVDYSISYSDNIMPGTASVTLTGLEPFAGEVVLTFKIITPKVPTLDEKVAQLKQECLASGAATDYDRALWFHNWLIHHANYDFTYTEYYADGVLLKGAGVCQSYALAMEMLLNSVGIQNVVVVSHSMDHAWNIAKLDGEWCHIDCTWDDPGSGGGENHAYFGLNDTFMSRDHTWPRGEYPACTSPYLNYYVVKGDYRCASTQEEFNAVIAEEAARGHEKISIYNTAASGFDLMAAFEVWSETEGWRVSSSGQSYSGSSYLLEITFIDLEPRSGAIDYTGDTEALKQDLSLLLSNGCVNLVIHNATGNPFSPEALFDVLNTVHHPLAAEYGSILPYSYRYSTYTQCIYVTMEYLNISSLPEPFELMSPRSAPSFSMKDANGSAITETSFGGKRVLLVYGRLTCPNTNALLSSLTAASSLLRKAGVEVVVGLFDLGPGDLQTANELYGSFHCADAGMSNGMWEALDLFGYGGSVTFPAVFLRETDGQLVYCSTGYVSNPLRLVATAIENKKPAAEPVKFVIPAAMTAIEDEAFSGCLTLKQVAFAGSSIKTIGSRAFADCVNLVRITIPSSVESIAADAFDGCKELTIVCEPNSTAYWHAVTYNIKWEIIE